MHAYNSETYTSSTKLPQELHLFSFALDTVPY